MESLKAAVIGVGHMGRNHARIYQELPSVELVAIVDQDERTARKMSIEHQCRAYFELDVMLDREDIDIASVVTPTVYHFEHASRLLDEGISVLIEKPITHTIEEAEALVCRASHPQVTVAVGHIERSNPAVHTVRGLIMTGAVGEIYRISTRRVGPSPVRIRDVGVTRDLATHDLDIMRFLSDSEPVSYQAFMQHKRHNGFDDAVNAIIEFENDIIGVLECDWLTPAKERKLTVVGSEGMIKANYLDRRVTLHQKPGSSKHCFVSTKEPLYLELENFVYATRNLIQPAATAEDGFAAVRMADQILKVGR
jgi:predicted dehydrogenase